MKCCHLLPCACPEVGVVILVREEAIRFKSPTKARQMARIPQAVDCRNVVTAFSLLFTPFGPPVLEPDLLETNERVNFTGICASVCLKVFTQRKMVSVTA